MRLSSTILLAFTVWFGGMSFSQEAPEAVKPENPAPSKPAATVKPRKKRLQPGEPHKRVVKSGGTSEKPPQMSPSVPELNASSQKKEINSILDSTEFNLKEIASRRPDANQQQTMAQIRVYIRQSREAMESGDLTQSRNLASKARVLSEELLTQ